MPQRPAVLTAFALQSPGDLLEVASLRLSYEAMWPRWRLPLKVGSLTPIPNFRSPMGSDSRRQSKVNPISRQ